MHKSLVCTGNCFSPYHITKRTGQVPITGQPVHLIESLLAEPNNPSIGSSSSGTDQGRRKVAFTAAAAATGALFLRSRKKATNDTSVIVNLTDLKQQPRRAEPQLYPFSEMPPGKCGRTDTRERQSKRGRDSSHGRASCGSFSHRPPARFPPTDPPMRGCVWVFQSGEREYLLGCRSMATTTTSATNKESKTSRREGNNRDQHVYAFWDRAKPGIPNSQKYLCTIVSSS